ncbi:CYFA0S27e00782g1_1 [Cyberlindnera fabianii]|uniref:CYFA0S27e00782g1_1 n=1 Tax=Cyberlindnera fabianii TaxID=36022 RepID=A0A061BCD3_CYBFA|nr:CYFA0S27e00782g1_1 [Cyberlindnera fabianii]
MVRTDEKESQDSQQIFKQLKFPDSESPWLNHIHDPFEDTPVTRKINMIGETPLNTKVRNPFQDTPETIFKKKKHTLEAALNTPSGHAAHRVFDKIREQQADQSDLQVESQMIPSLEFDTQKTGGSPTQMIHEPSGLVNTEEYDKSHITIPSDIGEVTLADQPENTNVSFNTTNNDAELSPESSQAALQIPGTAPEEDKDDESDMSLLRDVTFNGEVSSPVVSEDEDNTNKDSSSATRRYEFNAEDSLHIKHNRDKTERPAVQMSPDDSAVFRFPKTIPNIVDSPLSHAYTGAPSGSFPDSSRSQLHVVETPSRPAHSKSDLLVRGAVNRIMSSPTIVQATPTKEMDDTVEDENQIDMDANTTRDEADGVDIEEGKYLENDVTNEDERTTLVIEEEPQTEPVETLYEEPKQQVPKSSSDAPPTSTDIKQDDLTTQQYDHAANVTQDLSDIDDIDGKVVNDDVQTSLTNSQDEDGSRIIRRRARRKRVNTSTPSQETTKRLKPSPIKSQSRSPQKKGNILPNSSEELEAENYDNENTEHDSHDEEEENGMTDTNDTTDHDENTKNIDHYDDDDDNNNTDNGASGSHPLQLPTEVLREDKLVLSDDDIVSRTSVWHLYETYLYPGVVIGVEENLAVVKFNDRAQTATGLFPLDIRVGDSVTHDDTEYRVVGLECAMREHDDDVIRCMRGYDTVICHRIKKPTRKKTKNADQEFKFALADIKMAESVWLSNDRVGSVQEVSRRRSTQPSKPTVTFEDALVQSFSRKPIIDTSSVFAGCLFALTGLNEKHKSELEELIRANGGVIADDGFQPYFEILSGKNGLRQLKRSLTRFRFAALITSKPCRFAKYFEALALGWPVLSYEFIQHSVEFGSIRENLYTYLLPSGVSTSLHGATKSADISKFITNWKNDFDLSLQLNNNRILANKCVMIVEDDPSISKFLFHALGSQTKSIKLTTNSKLISDCATVSKSCSFPIYIYGRKMEQMHQWMKPFEAGNSRKGSVLKKLINGGIKEIELEIIDWDWLVECIVSGHPWKSSTMKIKP